MRDEAGRLHIGRSGSEARAAYGEAWNELYDGPYSVAVHYDVWGNITAKEGWGGDNPAFTASYTNNRRNGLTYDAAGNLTNDGGQSFTYDATGQQATASYSGYLLEQSCDGDRLRGKKIDNGTTTYYLRSSVLGGQVIAEINGSGAFTRGYVYLGGQLLAVQQNSQVSWVHQDPVTKSQRVTNSAGTVVSTIELDPWGGNTSRNSNDAFQPRKFTTYERDGNASDEAMHRRYNRWWSRFDQPDPYDGSYSLTNPQSFNRYAYVNNDPVNFVDPTGLHGYTVIPLTNGEICRIFGIGCGGAGPGSGGGGGNEMVPEDLPPTDGPTGGGGGGPGPQSPAREMAKFDVAKLMECVEAYGFDPNSVEFTPSQRGKGGSFRGYAPGDHQRINGVGVVNDLSYNSRQIGNMGLSPPGTGIAINGIGGRPDGRGFAEYSPYRNYTSSNLTNPIAIIATQIHELGHSLTMITGVRPETAPYSRLRPSGPDAGTSLERCVFGGEVGNDGRLYR